jgi:hypothetical protein
MGKSKGFRSWYYFRMGWSTYFAFIFAAINTLTVTYYLAIEKVPILESIFPSFFQYVIVVSVIGVPFLVLIGYAHYKRTRAFRSEADILIESNPFAARSIANSEMILELNLKFLDLVLGLYQNEKISDSELKQIKDLHKKIFDFKNSRTFSNNKDRDFIREELEQ